MTPFVLIPGLNCTARVYRDIAELLWPFGPVSIANHQSGETMAAIAEAILRDAPLRFALAGFSMGGYIAFEIVRRAPERVVRLALLDTSARPDTADSIENRNRRIALAEAGKFGLVIQQSFPNSVHPDNVGRGDLLALHRGMAEANGAAIYAQQQRAIIGRVDSRPDLAGIAVPTLIVVGDGDQITPPEMARELHAGIAGSRLVEVPRAGHLALFERPDIVHAALLEWARG